MTCEKLPVKSKVNSLFTVHVTSFSVRRRFRKTTTNKQTKKQQQQQQTRQSNTKRGIIYGGN